MSKKIKSLCETRKFSCFAGFVGGVLSTANPEAAAILKSLVPLFI
ncbi:hypothetical protein [Pseudoalteromonas sp. Of7M-16]|nr:hypothetical protein [Pseudoalteromonas sp. Of7M-16]